MSDLYLVRTSLFRKLSGVFVFWLLCVSSAQATADKFRLILTDDPATTATVAWNQVSGAQAVLRIDEVDRGGNAGAYAKTQWPDRVSEYRGMRTHFVRLKNLRPNTAYYFLITDSEGASRRMWFRTAPADRSRLSFIAGGDSRNNRDVRRKANSLVAKLKPHAVLFGGDMTDADNEQEWREWLDDWQLTISADGRLIPIVPARGNHEAPGTVWRLFDLPNELEYYSLTFGAGMMRFYSLNTEISVAGDQRNWLAQDLAAHRGDRWRVVQFHRPMRPHTYWKPEGTAQYAAWAQLLADERVRLAIDCDSHVAKTTFPILPSYEAGSSEGFLRDDSRGTVYTGEGCWGAPLKNADDPKPWTRTMGSYNEFKLLFVSESEIEHRTIRVDNADQVGEMSNNDPFTLPTGLDVFTPNGQGTIVIYPFGESPSICNAAGSPCDDGRADTQADEQNGTCQCAGVPANATRLQARIAQPTDDAEEDVASGRVNLWSSDLELIDDWGRQIVGLRFTGLVLPKGARIYRAYLQFCSESASSEATTLSIRGERQVPSRPFQGNATDLSVRTKTQAEVSWQNLAAWDQAGVCGLQQRSPDVAPIVQEIVTQPGWQSGEALHLLISGSGRRVAKSFEGGGGAELIVYYEAAGVACPPAGQPCDDGDAQTQNDRTNGTCGCAGVRNTCPPAGQPCDDGDAQTQNDRTNGTCGCAGVRNTCAPAGQPCDDGDALTQNDITNGTCGCAGVRITTPTVSTNTLTLRVTSFNDDAEERASDGLMYVSSSDLELPDDPGTIGAQVIGLRFTGVQVPVGATVTEAYLQFVADETHDRATRLEIRAERRGDAATYNTQAFNISQRPRTSAKVDWLDLRPWTAGERGETQRSPDLSVLLQEVFSLPDWRAGQAISIVISGSGQRVAVSADGRLSDAATLVIKYSHVQTMQAPSQGPTLLEQMRRELESLSAAFGQGTPAQASQPIKPTDLRIFPNPCRGDLTIELPFGKTACSVEVFNAAGARQQRVSWTGSTLDMSALTPGLYLLSVELDGAGKTWHKVVRE